VGLSLGMPAPREKRTAKVQGYITGSLKEYLERELAVHPHKSESDLVFEALELKRVISIANQKVGSRTGAD
jgi:hypothetical protein